MAYDIQQVINMSQDELDKLFSSGEVGEIPDGEAKGTAIIAPGTPYNYAIAQVINFFAWQGKIFDAKTSTLKNEISPFGFRAIIAKVYKDDSWFDHKPCIVLDYSETSTVAQRVRDEIRKVADKQYLGKVYWGNKHLIDFFLQF
ncbi:hypothetical protein [Nitrosospira multiformis]|uniref:Uncharacterized protein n=1 Tax=Nitrosospira multiformis (strain ATCC 25196 / NCIMB 11849 / C 71) TaxID=323848 RepID=Q2YBN5_NITMU|nr:hypothetical protein [Nitrosospira multiformis]ABB73836.1 conserved hypothetical protein [Nitrosospira multiformis ATCC 25196]SDZ73115.1 hypothetical protein SAMN05216411_10165 [Nitrosospira multiformis]SEF43073.1 hypothetical protein SAMN05216403_101268 [Nitrosospira multiformis ATCC 25196]